MARIIYFSVFSKQDIRLCQNYLKNSFITSISLISNIAPIFLCSILDISELATYHQTEIILVPDETQIIVS